MVGLLIRGIRTCLLVDFLDYPIRIRNKYGIRGQQAILSEIKKEAEGTLRLLWKKIDPKDLKPGDHIYSHKRYGFYSHHGIYVGDGFVIHFTRTETKNSVLRLPKAEKSVHPPPCPKCRYDERIDLGVVRTCVDCFRRGKEKLHSIRYFVYGAPRVGLLLKKSGTCTTLESSRTADDVVWEAYELFWKQGFGEYNLRSNNCEHFATFCRTGKRECTQMSFYNDLEEWFKSLIS
ncbi:uncharacterized protein LOC116208503 [Punica granatum]|uniref:Uncharacterized protein LOC116208503 n=1 Tax=Punica granatum TaxID=22663 RepID=A0A6P8DP45_PUNGR|nr:uncharacterized protein LOC116208503 [Punica granatum]